MKIRLKFLCLFFLCIFLLSVVSCQRITDEVYEEGRVVVTLDEDGLIQTDEEGFLFVSDDKVTTLSGSANTRAKVSEIQAEISCGKYQIATQELKPSQKWTFENPPLIWGYNQITIRVTADDGTTGEKTFAILSRQHNTDIEKETDSDGDGLWDYQEQIFGTDPQNYDTDGDGIGDYAELFLTRTDPTQADDGLKDADNDGDGLTNWREAEQQFGHPSLVDSDFDGLPDGDEAALGTNINANDSDQDGIVDGRDGQPTEPDVSMTVTVQGATDHYKTSTTEVSASITGSAEAVNSAHIRRLGSQNIFLNPSIPGYISSGYTLRIQGEAEVVLSVQYAGEAIEDPALYLFDTEEQVLVSLSAQERTAEGNIQARVQMPADGALTFILLDRADAAPYITTGETTGEAKSLDGYKNLAIDGTLRLGTGARLVGLSAGIADSDGDGIEDAEEAEIRVAGGKKFIYLHSDPTLPDSDFDGISDAEDELPLSYDVTDRSLALVCAIGTYDLSPYIGMTVGEVSETEEGAAALGVFAGSDEIRLLRDAEILAQTNNETREETVQQCVTFDFALGRYVAAAQVNEKGYGSFAVYFPGFEKNSAIAFAVRGTAHDQSEITDELIDRVMYAQINTTPVDKALAEYVKFWQYAGCDMYLTAHSTGGSILTEMLAQIYEEETALPARTVTFNAVGSCFAAQKNLSLFTRFKLLNSVVNYYYYGDILGEYLGKTELFARFGSDRGLTPADRDGKPLRSGNAASWTYHDIQYFCTDRQLMEIE